MCFNVLYSLRRGTNDKLFIGFNTTAIIRPPLLLPADGQLSFSDAKKGEKKNCIKAGLGWWKDKRGVGGGGWHKLLTEGVLVELSASCLLLPILSYSPILFSRLLSALLCFHLCRHLKKHPPCPASVLAFISPSVPLCPPPPTPSCSHHPYISVSVASGGDVPGQCNWYSGSVRANAEAC